MPETRFINDSVAFLEGCRRLAEGEWLGRDFSSPIGPAAFVPHVLALRFGTPLTAVFPLANTVWFAALAALAWWRTRRWQDRLVRTLFALGIGLIATSPALTGDAEWIRTSHAMHYNSLGVALAALLALETLAGRAIQPAGALYIGALSGVFFWLKITNTLSLLPIGAGFLMNSRRDTPRNLGRALGGFALSSILIWAAAHFSPQGYLSDCADMAATSGRAELGKLVAFARDYLPLLVAAFAIGVAGWASPVSAGLISIAGAGFNLAGAIALISSLQLFAFTHPVAYLPFIVVLCCYDAGTATTTRTMFIAIAALALAPVVAGWSYCVAWTARLGSRPPAALLGLAIAKPPSANLSAGPRHLRYTREADDNFDSALAYQDAIQLVQRHVLPTEVVAVADYTNPLVPAGAARGPQGDWITWHWSRNVGARQLPWLRQTFAETPWVLTWRIVPDWALGKTAAVADTVAATHEQAAESTWWVLWRRADRLTEKDHR